MAEEAAERAPGVSNRTTYGVDYLARIQARGGATLRLVLADPNCSQIKNCGPNNTGACSAPIIKAVDARAATLNPSFDFSSAYPGQWLVMLVTSVTAP